MHDEQHIRQRAYEIWEQEGRPDGREDEHWAQALREIEAEGIAPAPTAEAPEDSSSTVTAPDGGGTTPGRAVAVAAAVDIPKRTASRSAGRQASAAKPGKKRGA